jgi:hypothetical protein
MHDSNSLERGDESYHSNMFNFDENGKGADSNSHNSRSRESYDNIYKQKKIGIIPDSN